MDIVNDRHFDVNGSESVAISHFHTGAHYKRVYLDIANKHGITIEGVRLAYPEFLRFADTVAEIAKTIRENG